MAVSGSRLKAVCRTYGPGRLPRADRREFGAGYAGASAALGIALSYALLMAAAHVVGWPRNVGHLLLAASALAAIPIVVPVAFAAGVVVWRWLSPEGPVDGAVAGLLATVATYLGSLAVVGIVLFVAWSLQVTGTDLIGGAMAAGWFTVLIATFAVAWSAPLAIPVGCASGALYERARGA